MLLHRTQNAVAELAANGAQLLGGHQGDKVRVGGTGYVVEEVPFDVNLHDVWDINPSSLVAEISRTPYVPVVIPESPLDVNVVVHCDPAQEDDPESLVWGRKIVTRLLNDSLRESLLHGDTTKFYVVGRPDPDFLARGEAQHVKGTEEAGAAAEAVAKIARGGLTLVLSTFKNLPLDQVRRARYRSTVGIKTNHIWDRELGANIGVWDTGEPELPVVNTNDGFRGRTSKDLLQYRAIQVLRHQQVLQRLGGVNIKMAEAVFDKSQAHNFDVRATDRSIAGAIKRIGRR